MLPIYRLQKIKKRTSKKKTNEEYIKELRLKNSNIIPLDEYKGTDIKILHKCLVCFNEWCVKPAKLLRGTQCPKCSRIKNSISKEEYISKLEKQGLFSLISGFKGMKTPCTHLCFNCGNIWDENPAGVLYRKYCPKCKGQASNRFRKKTNEQYLKELNDKNIPVLPLEDINGCDVPIMHKCLIHNYDWKIRPSHVIKGKGCPICKKDKIFLARSIGHNEYLIRLKEINSNAYPIEKYKGMRHPIMHQYLCGHTRKVTPASVLMGHECKICSCIETARNRALSHNEYVKRVKEINPHIKILGTYISMINKIDCECIKCGYIWKVIPYSLFISGCPKCSSPHGEKRIKDFLEDNNIRYIPQYKYQDLLGSGRRKLSYDFYLLDYNTLLEFQGEQHERSIDYFGGEEKFKIQQEHDRRKREYAKEHEIDLLEIWYYDYDNIEQILSDYLDLNLESVETVIPA